MPRPCQNRRASAAAGRDAKKKDAPPIRHKAHQKAIHNTRHGRGRGRGRGAGPPNTLTRGAQNTHAGGRYNPIALDGTDDSLSDDMDDSELRGAENMVINVDTTRPAAPQGSGSQQGQVMFTHQQALAIFESMRQDGFPLPKHSRTRHEPPAGYMPVPPQPISNTASHDSAAPVRRNYSDALPAHVNASEPTAGKATGRASANVLPQHNLAKDYVFDWGRHSGKRFEDAPERYLRELGASIYENKGSSRRGLKAAFEYHRPHFVAPLKQPRNQRTQPRPQSQLAVPARPAQPTRPAPPTRPALPTRAAAAGRPLTRLNASMTPAQRPSETFRFSGGIFAGHALHEVPENYLRTLESSPTTFNMWPDFREALRDFNQRTRRRGPA